MYKSEDKGLKSLSLCLLIHLQFKTLGVAVELGRIHTLDICHAALVLAFVEYAKAVFEYVGSFWQVIDEEMARGIARCFVVTESILILVARKNIHRLGAAAALVF